MKTLEEYLEENDAGTELAAWVSVVQVGHLKGLAVMVMVEGIAVRGNVVAELDTGEHVSVLLDSAPVLVEATPDGSLIPLLDAPASDGHQCAFFEVMQLHISEVFPVNTHTIATTGSPPGAKAGMSGAAAILAKKIIAEASDERA